MTNPRFEKLKGLLKTLFQLDRPDLDFGLYRIMHARSAEITKFLDEDLLPQVNESFAELEATSAEEVRRELEEMEKEAAELGFDSPEAIPKYKDRYPALKRQLESAFDRAAAEGEVFDHLFRFFRRYYHEGDFISRRVYKEGVYAIPYEGEEVKLYWANHDQYYIKTSEYLRDYAFCLRPGDEKNPMRVHFRIKDAAEGEHGNVKESQKRVFVPAADNLVAIEDDQLICRFEYRPATLEDWPEEVRNGKTKPPDQKALNEIAEKRIIDAMQKGKTAKVFVEWLSELGKPYVKANGETADYTRLRAHINRYTARNTFDYFIHKDLGGFLRRELDFYIKNEVMHLDDIEKTTPERLDQLLAKIKVIRKIAGKIIAFLEQLENFQKKLWLKKKFVVETFWCVTLKTILDIEDEKERKWLLKQIAANDAQREEWLRLYAIDEQTGKGDLFTVAYSELLTVEFLEANPTLVVDTRHFDDEFTARLLDAIDGLDEKTDGLLVHSENFQALNLLQERYREKVKCIYIDPPYNTGNDGFAYKDAYQHSSWLTMTKDRLLLMRRTLKSDGTLFTSIDHNEISGLKAVLDNVFQGDNFEGLITWRRRHNQPNDRTKMIGLVAEYLLAYAKDGAALRRSGVGKLDLTGEFSNPDNDPRGDWASKPWKVGAGQSGTRYVIRTPTGKQLDEEWMGDESTYKALLADNRIIFPRGGDGYPRKKYFKFEREEEGQCASNWWEHSYFGHNAGANTTMTALFGEKNLINNPKPAELIRGIIQVSGRVVDVVADYFAGSGTTGHAVINLNREDGGRRKFILVEMGDYFDTVLLPRIKKVTFSPEWKDGTPLTPTLSPEGRGSRPQGRGSRPRGKGRLQLTPTLSPKETGSIYLSPLGRGRREAPGEGDWIARSPRVVKVVRLESYEDTLNNLELQRDELQGQLLFGRHSDVKDQKRFREEYLLKYMLDLETKGSPSLLDLDGFLDPTAYRLKVKIPGSEESRERTVDLVETFNYLIGLAVDHIAAPVHVTAKFKRAEDRDLPEENPRRLLLDGRLKEAPHPGPLPKGEREEGREKVWWFRTVSGTMPSGERALVIWRNRPGGEDPEGIEEDNLVLEEWFRKMGYSSKDSEYDIVYVNGDNTLENLKTGQERWKVRLIEETFFQRMFDVRDV